MDFVVLGCGHTGERVALRLLASGGRVIATSRRPERLAALGAAGAELRAYDALSGDPLDVPPGARVLHSIPVLETPHGPVDPTPAVLAALGDRPSRLVYLSTTGVYGAARRVDERTEAAPETERAKLRLAAETLVRAGPWSSLVLRPAAIYGPDRGVHLAIRAGRYRLAGAGENFVSRIHVDDLASIVEAALRSGLEGAYPVADDEPARAADVARFCAERLGVPMPPSAPAESLHETLRADRRVDGRAVRRLLGVELLYPTWREGLTDALRAG